MALTEFTPGQIIQSAQVNANMEGLADGTNDTTANSLSSFRSGALFDYVQTGGIITKNGSLSIDISAGTVVIGGSYLTFGTVVNRICNANSDTYVDLLKAGDGTATIVYTPVANNAASPALAANSLRLGIVVAGASITSTAASINQGQGTKVLPIASSIPYQTTDSLGNLIANTDPRRTMLGFRQITANYTATPGASTYANVTGLSMPIIVPPTIAGGVGVRFTLKGASMGTAGAAATTITVAIRESTTVLEYFEVQEPVSGYKVGCYFQSSPLILSTGSHTYLFSMQNSSASSHTLYAAATSPAFIMAELIR